MYISILFKTEMLKPFYFLFICTFIVTTVKAQTLSLTSNTSENDKTTSIIYKNFNNQFDLLIAFNNESYWWGNSKRYTLLAFKEGVCFKGTVSLKKNKHEVWSKPKLKLKKVNCDSAKQIVNYFNEAGFYLLNRDSLNINKKMINDTLFEVFTIDDGVNCKFEILSKKSFLIIESYEPDYFLKKIPELKSRRTFIKCRDFYLSKYKEL